MGEENQNLTVLIEENTIIPLPLHSHYMETALNNEVLDAVHC